MWMQPSASQVRMWRAMPGCRAPIPSKHKQRVGAVSYRKRSIEMQPAVAVKITVVNFTGNIKAFTTLGSPRGLVRVTDYNGDRSPPVFTTEALEFHYVVVHHYFSPPNNYTFTPLSTDTNLRVQHRRSYPLPLYPGAQGLHCHHCRNPQLLQLPPLLSSASRSRACGSW